MEITDIEKQEIFNLIRKTIEVKLFSKSERNPVIDSPIFKEKRGAFVTLKIGKNLRGCIGMIFPTDTLDETLKDMAISSAFRDPRFSPLSKDEYPKLNIEVSILTPPKKIDNIDEIEVGKHGLIISDGFHKGLLLPQVATEHHWDRDTFLSHTCLKAGLSKNTWKQKDNLTIEVFEALVFSEKDPD